MRRLLTIATALVLAAGVLIPHAGAGERVTGRAAALEYWTPERVAGAKPRQVVLDDPGGPVVTQSHSAEGDESGAPWPDGSSDPVDDLVGKVLFTLGTGDYVCSASTVAPDGGSTWVLLTAGHCVWDDALGLATNWVYVPDYEDVLQFGCSGPGRETNAAASCYAAESLHPTAGWLAAGDDYVHDVAFARMDSPLPAELAGVDLPVVTPGSAVGVVATAFGYPAAKMYSGSDLIYCHGTTVAGPAQYSANAVLECDMTGGSSGGPWYIDDGTGGRLAVSLNSFGLRSLNGFMFGPVFDSQATDALAAASDASVVITPVGVVVNPEGDTGSTIAHAVVELDRAIGEPVTVEWQTIDVPSNPAVAHPGEDYVAGSGTLTFPAGATVATVPIEVLGDTVDEPPLLFGEWGLISFSNPSPNATIDTSFFGLALVVIIDDD